MFLHKYHIVPLHFKPRADLRSERLPAAVTVSGYKSKVSIRKKRIKSENRYSINCHRLTAVQLK